MTGAFSRNGAVASGLLCTLLAGSVGATSCPPVVGPILADPRARFAFTGTAIFTVDLGIAPLTLFKVDQYWQGASFGVLPVWTPMSPFDSGEACLVFASLDMPWGPTTFSPCTPNAPLASSPDTSTLGVPKKPASALICVLLPLVLVSLSLMQIARRRNRRHSQA